MDVPEKYLQMGAAGIGDVVTSKRHLSTTEVYAVSVLTPVLADITAQVKADRDDLSARIAQGPEVHDWDQIDQWACERVALNRVLAILRGEARP